MPVERSSRCLDYKLTSEIETAEAAKSVTIWRSSLIIMSNVPHHIEASQLIYNDSQKNKVIWQRIISVLCSKRCFKKLVLVRTYTKLMMQSFPMAMRGSIFSRCKFEHDNMSMWYGELLFFAKTMLVLIYSITLVSRLLDFALSYLYFPCSFLLTENFCSLKFREYFAIKFERS